MPATTQMTRVFPCFKGSRLWCYPCLRITEPAKIAEMTPDQSQGGHRERHQGRVNELRSVYTAFVNLRQHHSTTLTNAAAAAAETIIATNSGPSASAGARFKPMLQL